MGSPMNAADQGGDKGGVQVIARAAAILRALEGEPQGLSLGEIADRVSLARSTVQRIVRALADEHFVMPGAGRATVRLGSGLLKLAGTIEMDITRLAKPAITALSRKCGETVDLSVLKDGAAVFIDQCLGSQRLLASSVVGEAFPLHSTANGKALLTCLPIEVRTALLARPLVKDTAATQTDPSLVEAEVRRAAKSGLAFDREEHSQGICAVGTAFLDALGRPHAISIPIPAQRFETKREMVESALLATRKAVVREVGGELPRPE